MRISCPDFDNGGRIPEAFTCDGEDVSPPLVIEDVPETAESLALIVEDPDAPGGSFVHWLLWNVPSDRTEVPEGVSHASTVEELDDAIQGRNNFNEIGYRGPCPPGGSPHHYRFRLYALDTTLDVSPGIDRATVENAMADHVVAEAELVGLFGH